MSCLANSTSSGGKWKWATTIPPAVLAVAACGGDDEPACEDDLTTRSEAVDRDSGSNYAVAFYDNDRDGRLSSGDKFTVRGNHGSEANGPAKDDWSLEVSFDNTGDVIGSKKLG